MFGIEGRKWKEEGKEAIASLGQEGKSYPPRGIDSPFCLLYYPSKTLKLIASLLSPVPRGNVLTRK
jgi:hypothetical protein